MSVHIASSYPDDGLAFTNATYRPISPSVGLRESAARNSSRIFCSGVPLMLLTRLTIPPPVTDLLLVLECESAAEPEIINGQLSLVGATPSFADGPAFHLEATWTNTSPDSFFDVFFDVAILQGAACQCEMADDTGPLGGVGTDIPLDLGPDGLWTPGESVTHTFWVNLTRQARLTFFGDVWGTPAAP